MKKRATWNGMVIAESDDLVNMENNYYFPMASVDQSLIKRSNTTSHCPWKGTANYFSLIVSEKENKDAMWYYEDPSNAAKAIRDRVAFWKGVIIEDV